MIVNIIVWLSTILSFGGYWFMNRKNVKGFYLFMIGNILTIVFDIITKNYAQMVMFMVFIYFNIDGIIKWSKNTKKGIAINE
jgi:nicotinamide riboside transporter PnuC